jgi:membrane-anchored glycerophosphoryl diester phosphodiesterase (GDPDase)
MSGLLESLVDALKSQPAVLALTAANFALLLFIYHGLAAAAENRESLIKQVFEAVQRCQTNPPTL